MMLEDLTYQLVSTFSEINHIKNHRNLFNCASKLKLFHKGFNNKFLLIEQIHNIKIKNRQYKLQNKSIEFKWQN